jgi:hydroxyacylglutathione hydrolase
VAVQFHTLAVGPLETNCYVIWDAQTHQAAIIDPGGDMDAIVDCAASNGLDVKYVLLTHGHPDHCFVAGDLARHYGTDVYMHQSDIEQVQMGVALAETLFYDVSNYIEFLPSRLLDDGDVLPLGEWAIDVIHTPGHSRGGICFVTDAGVFCGDTVFAGSIGRTDFPGGSYPELIASINTKLLSMKDETPLYPGHGPSTTVGRERATNPFLASGV